MGLLNATLIVARINTGYKNGAVRRLSFARFKVSAVVLETEFRSSNKIYRCVNM